MGAQSRLGSKYEDGYAIIGGVKQDFDEAARWYRKAAEQGYAIAQCNLSVFRPERPGPFVS